MSTQHNIDIERLGKQVTDLSDALARLSNADDFKHLIQILKHPGWTTPAEYIFASAILNSMAAHAAALTNLKGQLLKGSEAVVAR
jgi:hypothetical protein